MKLSSKAAFVDKSLPIHQRYSNLLNNLRKASPILKTDLWNELNTKWPINADIFVEFDNDMVTKAKNIGLNAIYGDINALPFENESISTIIDLSTIDHVPDPFPVLKEYHRVLQKKVNSNCYIVVWLGSKAPVKMNNWDGYQFYFDESSFKASIIKTGFRIVSVETFAGLGDKSRSLKFFHLKMPKTSILKKVFRFQNPI